MGVEPCLADFKENALPTVLPLQPLAFCNTQNHVFRQLLPGLEQREYDPNCQTLGRGFVTSPGEEPLSVEQFRGPDPVAEFPDLCARKT